MLGWIYWDPHRDILTIPWINCPLGWYGFFFALGFLVAYFLLIPIFSYQLRKDSFNLDSSHIKRESTSLVDALSWFIVGGTLVGSRLGHVFIYDWPHYYHSPLDIFKIWEGGLASHGGAIGILIALGLYLHFFQKQYKWMSYLTLLDMLVIPVPLTGMFIRIGNFFNQEILGTVTEKPWGVIFGHPIDARGLIPRHPVQLYEAGFYLFIFCCLWIIWQKKKEIMPKGFMSGLFFVTLFVSRFILEYFKASQESYLGEYSLLNMGQFLSIPFILAGIGLIYRSLTREEKIGSMT